LKKLIETYPKDVRVVFKQMPLGFHKDALPAAKAALAAQKQGKFWEYHDVLFDNYKQLKRADLETYARELGLNMKKFVADMDSPEVAAQVDTDLAEAKRIGVRGTPNSFVNGVPVKGARPYEGFKRVVDAELAKARGEKVPEARAGAGRGAAAPKMGLVGEKKVRLDLNGAITRGGKRAKNEIVAFVDLQDSFTGEVLQTLQKMQKKDRSIRLVVQHFPLGFHKLAQKAAEVAEAVHGDVGDKVWGYMNDTTGSARDLTKEKLRKLALKAGAKASVVDAALAGDRYAAAVKADYKEARANGAMATPTLFLNGRRYSGLKGYDASAIREALKASR
jgi:protein-disulfide isomerase